MNTTAPDSRMPALRLVDTSSHPNDLNARDAGSSVVADIDSVSTPKSAQRQLWGAMRDVFEGTDLGVRVRHVLDSVGAERVHLSERLVAKTEDRCQDYVKMHHPMFDPVDSTEKWAAFVEAYNVMNREIRRHNCAPPRFTEPDSFTNRYITNRQPFGVSTVPSDERLFLELGMACLNDCMGFGVRDMAAVPMSGGAIGEPIKFVVFTGDRVFEEVESLRAAALAIIGMVGLEQAKGESTGRMRYHLSDREIEIYSWAIKGKTVEEISMITDFTVQSVRYSLYRVRDLLGYATVAQAMVHVAKAYDIAP